MGVEKIKEWAGLKLRVEVEPASLHTFGKTKPHSHKNLGITMELPLPLKPQLPRLLDNSDLSATNSGLLIHGFSGIRKCT